MPGPKEDSQILYVLDTNVISEIFRAYYQDRFPSFWERFNELVRAGRTVSVRAVETELEANGRGSVSRAVAYLKNLNRDFFPNPSEQEQVLVREMYNDSDLSSANNRWRRRLTEGRDDADPYLITRARVPSGLQAEQVVVTLESPTKSANIPQICQRLGVRCINLQQMMAELGWQF